MAKRVSLKGRGADIFFGDYASEPTDAPVTEASTNATTDADSAASRPTLVEGAGAPVEMRASKQAHKVGQQRRRSQPPTAAVPQIAEQERIEEAPLPTAAILAAVGDELLAPATITNSFRYTQDELDALNDAVYAVTRRHRVRLSKQEVARLGLNLILWDHRLHGDASLLERLAQRRKRKGADE